MREDESAGAGRDGTILRPDRYQGFRPIGAGGMEIVYLALDTELNRQIAVKIVRPPATRAGAGEGDEVPFDIAPPKPGLPSSDAYAELTDRFLQEAWLTGALEHPGIVPVYEMGRTPAGIPYYTMRYVKGVRTLEKELREARTLGDRLEILDPFL